MNKIYFAGAIRSSRDDVALYLEIVKHLRTHGKVLTEHIADKGLTLMGEDGLSDIFIHDRDFNWLLESNVVVAEVTKASLGVGYEIGRMVERNLWVPESQRKHILCLYRPQVDRRLSAMIAGCRDLRSIEYQDLEQAKREIDIFFNSFRSKTRCPTTP